MWISLQIPTYSKLDSNLKSQFLGESRIVEDIYNRFLAEEKVRIKGVKKITITLTEEPDIYRISPPLKGFTPVVVAQKSYDFDQHFKLSADRRKWAILDFIQNCLKECAKKFDWDESVFTKVFSKVDQTGLAHRYYEIPLKASKDKSKMAGVEVEMLEEGALIQIVFLNEAQEIIRKVPIIKVHPNRMFVNQIVGNGKWVNNVEFVFSNKTGEINFKASIDEDNASIFFTSKSGDEDGLIDDLLFASVSTSKEQLLDILDDKVKNVLKNKN